MATETVWEGTVNSLFQLKIESTNAGLFVTLRRRAIVPETEGPPKATWLIHSQLLVWWPSSVDESLRLLGHWLDFYDTTLKAHLAPLNERLATIHESQTPGSIPPQAKSLN